MIWEWKEYRIRCDKCKVEGTLTERSIWDNTVKDSNRVGQMMPFSTTGKRHMARTAKHFGWYIGRSEHLCPNCYRKAG